MIDLEAIRRRNEERKRRLFSALARKTAVVAGDPRTAESVCDDIDTLLAEVERLRLCAGEATADEWRKVIASATTATEEAYLESRARHFIPGFTSGAAKV